MGLIFLITVCWCRFQQPDTIPVQQYQTLKYIAESHLINQDYNKATKSYMKLADSFYLWNGELQNALTCSLLSKDKKAIERFINLFFERGANSNFLEKKYKDFEYFNSIKWEKLKANQIKITYDSTMQVLVDSLHKKDQLGGRSISDSERMKNDFENLIKFYKIIDENGFPTQQQLGYIINADSIEYNNLFEIVLIHLAKLQPWELGILLKDLYFDNKIPCSQFVYLYSNTKSCEDIQLSCFPYPPTNALMVDSVLFTCNSQERQRIDRNRAKYFLDTIENQLEKIKFIKVSKYPWVLGEGTAIYFYSKKYTFDSFSKKLEGEGLIPYLLNK